MSKPKVKLSLSFTSPERGSSESPFSHIHQIQYDPLSSQIIEELKDKSFNAIIFDFDGTLTKYHSHRANNRDNLGYSGDWFSNDILLRQILEKATQSGIKIYITSKQHEDFITKILQEHGLDQYFSEIHGATTDKADAILSIASKDTLQKALYFDDVPENIDHDKIKIIKGLLQELKSEKPLRASQDIDGEAGLSFEKWQKTLSCIRTNDYDISVSAAYIPAMSLPPLDLLAMSPLPSREEQEYEENLFTERRASTSRANMFSLPPSPSVGIESSQRKESGSLFVSRLHEATSDSEASPAKRLKQNHSTETIGRE